jgi:hypothetical protein
MCSPEFRSMLIALDRNASVRRTEDANARVDELKDILCCLGMEKSIDNLLD